jgi:2-keto-4-pentenoate hydratase/2-oxohepta-3-ene-1,7-dioic acid hydratase in catechol pathway
VRLVTTSRGLGALRGADVVDLSPVAASVLQLIMLGEEGLERARAHVEEADPLLDGRLLAPVPRPPNHVYCVGWNYPQHYDEGVGKRAGQETEQLARPAFFTKPAGAVIGPGDAIAYDSEVTEQLDYEGELAVVLARGGRSIREEDALGHVFGYTLANDVSARDVQRRHGGQWLKGKGMDTYCPLGPVLVTADEIDPRALVLRCSVNGEVRQEMSTGAMIFPIETLVAELSFGMTLDPGDVLLTGTPPGVGFAREPQVFLRPGDLVEVEIDEIGRLANPVEHASLAQPRGASAASKSRVTAAPPAGSTAAT